MKKKQEKEKDPKYEKRNLEKVPNSLSILSKSQGPMGLAENRKEKRSLNSKHHKRA
jgi:hypothetical protein